MKGKVMRSIENFDISIYKDKLLSYLSAWKPDLELTLNPHPIHIKMTAGNEVSEADMYTIEIEIKSSAIDPRGIKYALTNYERELDDSNSHVWHDAYEIQDEYYKQLELSRNLPNSEEIYWKLWDHLEGIKT